VKRRVLFLCTGNSARSQIAEGTLRYLAGDEYEVFSAGTEPKGMHPLAVQVMRESGIDISDQRSKSLDEYLRSPFDAVITVCDRANEQCPVFPGNGERIHWSFDDPAAAESTEEQRLAVFRRVRDEIARSIQGFVTAGGQGEE
jgi:arsenate reductase